MLRALMDAMDRPGRVLLLILGLGLGYFILDAVIAIIVLGFSEWQASLTLSSGVIFTRTAEMLLVVIVAVIIELVLARYRRTARELRAEQLRLQTVYDKNPAAILTLDRDLVVSYANTKVGEAVGNDTGQIVGQVCHKAIVGLDEPCEGCLVSQVFETGKPYSRIKHEVTVTGKENWLSQVWHPLRDADGNIESVVEIATDISGLKLDPLTSLPNRILLRDRLDLALASARRHGQNVALLFMDIDGFKQTNDTMGHAVGDELLKGFAERLRGIVRQDETLARIGGDEFVLLLPSVTSSREAIRFAERVIGHIEAPIVVDGNSVSVATSIGVALYDGSETAEELLSRADGAMYGAKMSGGNTYQVAS